ncbi:MAG: pyridoxamine 5'-phosphate oxidase family protein [Actinobacteria bacterium]|nr:pyridoxamine 5'-phosphate oxidase family protein [Actinomycetota bacterium]
MSESDQGKPQPSRPVMPGYGVPKTKKGLLSWEYVTGRLTAVRDYWVGTAGSTGAPHAVPVWGVWVDDGLYFSGGNDVRWVRNVRGNPQVAVHIGSGDEPVIVEGTVMLTEEQGDEAERVMDAYEFKYGFRHPPPFWRLTPRRAFAWTDLGKDATRWVLPDSS